MDRELVQLARDLGAAPVMEGFQLLDKRLKDAPVGRDDEVMLWEVENAHARMVLKDKVYQLAGHVRDTIRSQQLLYTALDAILKDYCEKTGGEAQLDLPKVLLDEIDKLASAYKKLRQNIEGQNKIKDGVLNKLTVMRRDLNKIVRNNAPWQQIFDSAYAYLVKSGNHMDMLDPQIWDWATTKVKGVPEKEE